MRTFHIDPIRRIGAAPDYITGALVLFMLDGPYQETVARIGKRSRALHKTSGDDVIVGSACGIFRIDISNWPPKDRNASRSGRAP